MTREEPQINYLELKVRNLSDEEYWCSTCRYSSYKLLPARHEILSLILQVFVISKTVNISVESGPAGAQDKNKPEQSKVEDGEGDEGGGEGRDQA